MGNHPDIAIFRRAARSPLSTLSLKVGAVTNFLSRWQFRIEWGHCDPAGIVFNSRFFEFFDWGTWMLFDRALGVKPPSLAAAFGIVGIPVIDATARFLAPARFGEVVELTSQVSEFGASRFDVEHRLIVRDALAVEGRESRMWATRDPDDPSQFRAQPVPEAVIARLRAR